MSIAARYFVPPTKLHKQNECQFNPILKFSHRFASTEMSWGWPPPLWAKKYLEDIFGHNCLLTPRKLLFSSVLEMYRIKPTKTGLNN